MSSFKSKLPPCMHFMEWNESFISSGNYVNSLLGILTVKLAWLATYRKIFTDFICVIKGFLATILFQPGTLVGQLSHLFMFLTFHFAGTVDYLLKIVGLGNWIFLKCSDNFYNTIKMRAWSFTCCIRSWHYFLQEVFNCWLFAEHKVPSCQGSVEEKQ